MKLESMDFSGAEIRKASNNPVTGVNTGIVITEAAQRGDSLELGFEFSALYSPDPSYIRMRGRAVFSGKEIGSAYQEWLKTKKVSGEAGEYIVNAINHHSSINSIVMAKAFNLASPVVLPRLLIEKTSEKPAQKKK